jgi:hypothetical protein
VERLDRTAGVFPVGRPKRDPPDSPDKTPPPQPSSGTNPFTLLLILVLLILGLPNRSVPSWEDPKASYKTANHRYALDI